MVPKRKVHPLVKALVVVLLLAGVGILFVRTARDSRSEPYDVESRWLTGWTLGIDASPDTEALVSLRPPVELPMNLFRQLFSRQMESLSTPIEAGIPLVLRREVPADFKAEAVVRLARQAGFEQARLAPRCVGYRRISNLGVVRQLYFLAFDLPGYQRFRAQVAPIAGPGFEPDGLSPVLLMAAQPDFTGWQPIVVDAARDCVAGVTVR